MRATWFTSYRRGLAWALVCLAVATGGLVLVSHRRGDPSPVQPRPVARPAAPSPRSGAWSTILSEDASSRSTGSGAPLQPLPPLVRTDDPVAYARAVAVALFSVSESKVRRSAFLKMWAGELPDVVYSDAAAKGLTLKAQNADAIDNLTTWWIPTQAVWNSERGERTTSHFLVTSVSVPDYWANVVADGTLVDPGLRMERVMGVLAQTYGADPAHRHSSSRSVVIDIGLLCGPTQAGGCRLLAPQAPGS